MQASQRDNGPGFIGALLMVDIDHFKRVNDSFGHDVGDLIIKCVARAITGALRAYDIVVNGREVGSGSIRITDPDIQRRVFAAIGIDGEAARRKFGFLLEAFEYGVPPHGGWAGGIDRMLMEGLAEENIRDVIAFPKNQQAQEPMTDAPAPVDEAQLRELGLTLPPSRWNESAQPKPPFSERR